MKNEPRSSWPRCVLSDRVPLMRQLFWEGSDVVHNRPLYQRAVINLWYIVHQCSLYPEACSDNDRITSYMYLSSYRNLPTNSVCNGKEGLSQWIIFLLWAFGMGFLMPKLCFLDNALGGNLKPVLNVLYLFQCFCKMLTMKSEEV